MDDRTLKCIPSTTATEAAPGFKPSGEGVAAPSPDESPLAYLEALAGAGHFAEAEDFLAAALPRREAVWWACLCARSALGPTPSEPAELALKAAETWAVSPGDVNRRKAMTAAEGVGFGHPAGCVALAAFLSGGSLVPPELKDVAPPEHAFRTALAGSIRLALAQVDPPSMVEADRRFLALGLAVARGEERWKSPN